jgi:hypothetical protein
MSAWDVTGAVMWSAIALLYWFWCFDKAMKEEPASSQSLTGFIFALASTAAAIFCIARLCGAHL